MNNKGSFCTMATISMTAAYNSLDPWPGRLFQAEGDEVFLARTSTSYSWRYGANSDFAGFTVTVAGSGFGYQAGDPITGTMSALTIRNAAGQTVLSITGLTGFAADLSQFFANVFGGGAEGPGPDGKIAWSHLMSGNDIINGTAFEDRRLLQGVDAGNDTFNMGAGDDQVAGGLGNDTYFGGTGEDELTFRETQWNEGMTAIRGATINRETGLVLDPWGGTDRMFDFERFVGSRFNDVFFGSQTEEDIFRGMRGRDTMDGGANTFDSLGNQTDDDRDTVEYSDDHWGGGRFGIVVDLETSLVGGSIRGFARDGFGNTDVLIDIEEVEGTRYGDSFIGSRVFNRFGGGEGRDTYDGGAGWDELRFDRAFADVGPAGVNVNLALATGQIINDGFGNTENAFNFESLLGSDSDDTLRGNAQNNDIEGQRGADTLAGQGGNDFFIFASPNDVDAADSILDFAATGAGIDRLGFDSTQWAGMTTTVVLVNGTAATSAAGTFLFVNATDRLIWDANGTGAGGQTLVAVLNGVSALSAANFELWD